MQESYGFYGFHGFGGPRFFILRPWLRCKMGSHWVTSGGDSSSEVGENKSRVPRGHVGPSVAHATLTYRSTASNKRTRVVFRSSIVTFSLSRLPWERESATANTDCDYLDANIEGGGGGEEVEEKEVLSARERLSLSASLFHRFHVSSRSM